MEIMCRICLVEMTDDTIFHYISDNKLETKLLEFFPEIDLSIIPNPVVCDQCRIMIDQFHEFKKLCIENENTLKNQILLKSQHMSTLVKDETLIKTIKEEFVEEFEDVNVPRIEENLCYYCYECNYSTNDRRNLTYHIFTHCFKCDFCSYATCSKSLLIAHNEVCSNVIKTEHFQCTSNNSLLTVHKEIRSNIEPLQCQVKVTSQKKQKNKITVEQHMVSHKRITLQHDLQPKSSNKNKYEIKCEKCSYSTSNKHNLNCHVYRMHEGRLKQKCKLCNYATIDKRQLISHISTHTEEKPFKCKLCDYSCNHTKTLKAHMCKHSGKWPFECEKCDYKTFTKYKMKNHIKRHTKEKPFKCDVCDYCSNHVHDLKAHLYKHSGDWPFVCKTCDYKTHSKSVFAKHEAAHAGLCRKKNVS